MLGQFENHISNHFSFLQGKKLLLAVSGGLDSMVLVHLFQQLNYEIVVLHCNFQLRGLVSFEDQQFIQEYSNTNAIPFVFTQFDTEAFAADCKVSIQVAARELRYSWFYEQLAIQKGDFILTAHHADDNLETFLINLSRGTGLEGLTGIPAQNEKVIRPLLSFSRQQMEEYASVNKLKWREDSSNASDKYLRNKIRHHLVPLLKELNPNFMSSFEKTQSFLSEAQELVDDAAIMVYQQVAREEGEDIYFDLVRLLQLPNYSSYLYQWLKEFGFTAWDDIYELVTSQSGKQVVAPYFRLIKDRDCLILSPLPSQDNQQEFEIESVESKVKFPLNLVFSIVSKIGVASNSTIFVDQDKLVFPLTLRHWNEGDVFQPFGMEGKSKKVSKLFKDEKLSLIDKEKVWLLCSNNQVVWVVGIRQDERFKIDPNSKNLLKIECIE
ncbi:tRNA lysidine(34) synthetase TilS [Flavobacterium ammonificans]|uniref:tRNA lysidine(34) synthetase TilS n=1 Tax=Flavobacterium ammonificans TaxID=1751056 RepID=UPI001E3F55F8|nr:tRNA lysidine(34) synthetase TilS [Flavobacterium ammonificans]BDB57230.1 tRNA(Ile)-lysidine synthase [Flavobacterium ammonificans]